MLETAAERARDAEIWRSAARLYDDALAVAVARPRRTRRAGASSSAGRVPSPSSASWTAARTDVEDVLEDASADDRVTARALTVLGDLQQMEGDYVASIATLERAIDMWRELGDAAGEVDALRAHGGTVMFQGDLDSAESDMSQALELFRQVGDRRGEAWAVQNPRHDRVLPGLIRANLTTCMR